MDFFEYATIALRFVNSDTLYVPLIVGGLCFLLVFIFQGLGLYVIAGREGYKNRWMAFVPFANTYFIGVCGQKNRAFRSISTKTIALIASILEGLLFAGYLVYFIAYFQLIAGGCVYEMVEDSIYGQIVTLYLKNVPVSLAWAGWCYEFLYTYILSWLDIIFVFLQVFILSAFFQTYAPRRYFLFTLTSVLLPVQGIFIFVLRNNRGMNYRDFVRMEQERQYRMYQQYQGQNFNNPYGRNGYENYNNYGNGQGGYGNNQSEPQNTRPAPEDPFSEYGGKGGKNDDPFEN